MNPESLRRTTPWILAPLCALALAASAEAQNSTTASATTASATAETTSTTQPADQTEGARQRSPWWEFIPGWEGDTHGTGYAFAGPTYHHPISDDVTFYARLFGNYLYYEFEERGGEVSVRSPGLSPSVGFKFGHKPSFKIAAGPDVKFRKREFTDSRGLTTTIEDETKVGFHVGADMYADWSGNVVQALANYGAADKYFWSRLGYKRQVSNRRWQGPTTWYVGVEGTGQGNDDIKSWQIGPTFELLFARSQLSLQTGVGYKKSTFDVGPDKDGPYFRVGMYKRF